MTLKNNINVSKVESYLYSIMNKKVSDNTFVGTLPNTTKSSWSDMCLIDVGSSINDMNAYGNGVVLIWLYAKPLSNGNKNVALLSKMEAKLNNVINTAFDENYRISRLNTYTDYDSTRKWHCNIVELNLMIF